ncbi:MAG TPA: baseplate J/gp47 family protein [Candidatus Intestinimonas pullistercoris]|uniref:Baseplate J/gp47 family protein n=2 Tax=Intestinimonas TaxID=1392389 RepID=A0A9D2NYK3_9FIRM|nr:baseplate J/gp47 family protein [Candidatus Intestinimonas pullistercoris]
MEAAGSGDLAARMYAVAAQLWGLYVQCDWVNRQCFPQTAQGEYLDLHAQLRGVERREATAAEGVLRFTVDAAGAADREIAAGTVCMTAGLTRFETIEAGTLEAGETSVDIRARALEAGSAGNVAAGTILQMAVAPVGVSRCTNPAAFTGGTDREDDETLRARVLETYRRLPNGANAAFYQQGALSFDEVAAAAVIPRPRGVGSVDVVVSTAAGAPSAELLEELEDYFEARREIAVDVQVRAPEMETVDVTVQVAAEEGQDAQAVQDAVEAALRGWFDGRRLGQSVLRAALGELVFHVEGVANYALTAPAADVAVEVDVLPRLGTLAVEAMV